MVAALFVFFARPVVFVFSVSVVVVCLHLLFLHLESVAFVLDDVLVVVAVKKN